MGLISMLFYPEEKIGLFIDGSNLYAAARALGFDIDYKRLLDLFGAKGRLIRFAKKPGRADSSPCNPVSGGGHCRFCLIHPRAQG